MVTETYRTAAYRTITHWRGNRAVWRPCRRVWRRTSCCWQVLPPAERHLILSSSRQVDLVIFQG